MAELDRKYQQAATELGQSREEHPHIITFTLKLLEKDLGVFVNSLLIQG